MKPPLNITIQSGDNGYTVRCGDRWQDSLTFDEALGAVAGALLHHSGVSSHTFLRTDEEHAARERAWEQMRNRSSGFPQPDPPLQLTEVRE